MSIPAPYLQITGHPVDLNQDAFQVYSDEFKHVVVHYYVSARNDPRYMDVRFTMAGKVFIKALFSRDIVPQWTLFGGTFVVITEDGLVPISNHRAIELLCERFIYQKHISNWELSGYGYLRRVLFCDSCSDSVITSEGKAVINEETPLFPPTVYITEASQHHYVEDPVLSRKIYNKKRSTIDKRKFSGNNNRYVNGGLYHHIPDTCGRIIPDNIHNSRIVVKVKLDNNKWSRIVITKYHSSRLHRINGLSHPFHDAFESTNSGKCFLYNDVSFVEFVLKSFQSYFLFPIQVMQEIKLLLALPIANKVLE